MTSLPRKIPKLTSPSRVPLPTSTKKTNLLLGSRVSISGQREGILRYYGNTEFADGLWCGVELFDASGKNDGEVSGVRYFQCAENHGVFAASHKVTAVSDVQAAGHLSTASANSDVNGNRVESLDHSGVLDKSLVLFNCSTFTTSDQSACHSVERLRRPSSIDELPAPGCNRTFDLPTTGRKPVMSDNSILSLSGLDTSFGVGNMAGISAPVETAAGRRERSPPGQPARFSTPSGDRWIRNGIAMSTPQKGAIYELGEDGFLPFDEEEMARETARILDALQQIQGTVEGDAPSTDSMLMLSNLTDVPEHQQYDVSGQQVLNANASCETCAVNPALNATQTLDRPSNTTQTLDCPANTTQTLDCPVNTTQTLDHPANTTQTLDCPANTTQTLDCPANTTQTLDCPVNTTQTLDCASTRPLDNGLNITSALPENMNSQNPDNEMNTAQVLNGTHEVDSQLNSTVTVEGHANTTQTLTEVTQPHLRSTVVLPSDDLRAEENETVSDVMRMSVDESSTSKGGNNSMALSTDSAAIAEELPADRASMNTESASNQRTVCNESGQSEASSLVNAAQNHMQVDEVANPKKPAAKKDKDGRPPMQVKNSMPDRRRILPAPTSKSAMKQRESLLPSTANKTREKEKSPARQDPPPKAVQKSKPKSKWADISKQIEQSAKAPKSPPKPIQSKLSAAALRKPVERATSTSSDISQNSQTSISSSKKPLKRHTLVPPATSNQKQEFKKPRASLLPPPPSRNSGPKPKFKGAEGKLKAPKAVTGLATTNSTNSSSQHSDGPPPDVVASNSPASKAKPTPLNKTAGKASHDKLNTKSEVVRLQSELVDALRVIDCKSRYADGLKSELVKANKSLEGLGVVVQHLTHVAEVKEQELATSREASMQLSQSHQQQLMACQNETELLTKNHEDEKRAVVARLMEEREKDMARLALDKERMREELSRACAEDVEKLTREHEEEKTTLMKEIDHLKGECASWKVRFDEALHKNKDHKLQEIESLKAVVELKNAEVKELRCENNIYQQKVETIPDLEKKLYDTKQRLENAQALLDIVSSKEKETADKYHKITRKAVQEKKENHRLSLNVEALELKLEEVEFTNSMHLAPDTNASDLDISTASLPAYGLENPDMSPSLFTRSFSRSSAKRRSQRGSNNTVEIPEEERQISPAKHLIFRSPSSSPSPTRVTSPRRPHFNLPPGTSSSTLPRSYRPGKHTRCHSDSTNVSRDRTNDE